MSDIKVQEIQANDYLTISKLPDSDYVINPYVGCTHACKYCYACFMKRFTGHTEEWGTFVDVKLCDKPINLKKIANKQVFLSSVTDCYNHMEEKYQITRKILKQLVNSNAQVGISTKSKLILRDIDILKQIKNLVVSISINTTDENFRKDMDNASSIADRIHTLKTLHNEGIKTVCFISPIFPKITDYKEIINLTKDAVDEYWFENLNLRGSYKHSILKYIQNKYPQYLETYEKIYNKKDKTYWQELALDINDYCKKNNINFKNYFYHEEIRKN